MPPSEKDFRSSPVGAQEKRWSNLVFHLIFILVSTFSAAKKIFFSGDSPSFGIPPGDICLAVWVLDHLINNAVGCLLFYTPLGA